MNFSFFVVFSFFLQFMVYNPAKTQYNFLSEKPLPERTASQKGLSGGGNAWERRGAAESLPAGGRKADGTASPADFPAGGTQDFRGKCGSAAPPLERIDARMGRSGQKAYLVLENGTVFEGRRFGASGDVTGEIVFTTAMTGYLETLTDPSYYGQIVVQTFPLIGNYGVIPLDFESASPALKAYIVREQCQEPSNFRSEGVLGAFLESAGIVGLYGLDTRALTRIIREYGVMNAQIVSSKQEAEACLASLAGYKVENAVNAVTCRQPVPPSGSGERRVVLWDFGAKANIRRELEKRGCAVTTVPAGTTAEEIAAMAPDGVMLSNGPGDPAENTAIIEELRRLCERKLPLFGICLGHQLLALSQGAKTAKLKYGHRGANQPVRDTETGRVYITSQNHGYAVVTDSLPENARLSFANANDGTSEGIAYRDMPAFSVQFHPEACGGPQDTSFLFDRFIAMIDQCRGR